MRSTPCLGGFFAETLEREEAIFGYRLEAAQGIEPRGGDGLCRSQFLSE